MNQLHIYAQSHWHDLVIIVGDDDALESLQRAISAARLHNTSESDTVFVNDGEGYNVLVYRASQEEIDKLPVPYTDEIAGVKDWSELIKLIKERSTK
jgi:predicted transcriptional regulator